MAPIKIEERDHITSFKEEINSVAQLGKDNFFTWFNGGENAEASFIRGSWDFCVHIAFPLSKYIKRPEDLVALEIGHGGGRILALSSRSFDWG